jgi:hypothetical protein
MKSARGAHKDVKVEKVYLQTLEFCENDSYDFRAVEKFAKEIIRQNYKLIIQLPEENKGCWCDSLLWNDEKRVTLLLDICDNLGIRYHLTGKIFGDTRQYKRIYYPRCLSRERLIVTCCRTRAEKWEDMGTHGRSMTSITARWNMLSRIVEGKERSPWHRDWEWKKIGEAETKGDVDQLMTKYLDENA